MKKYTNTAALLPYERQLGDNHTLSERGIRPVLDRHASLSRLLQQNAAFDSNGRARRAQARVAPSLSLSLVLPVEEALPQVIRVSPGVDL